ncbi:MAG: LPP20 family lipoprotein [Methylomonas sp.]|nr:LPP20 family lipoprotein [Methylomonas sp.]PPD20226.1 MAG: hypothetical protein CTY23_09510 [Methylomonas sp.]PPD26256.1 MAG: hypothetical protein CTY22_05755 [Methylomonas sp.]PPD37972.1 MAG: hypothetical protein CTY21_05750 [Methylomonas sp.]PPD40355.1 MAG: hypothetical protein CTY17_06580 [Methylomonas sp.]
MDNTTFISILALAACLTLTACNATGGRRADVPPVPTTLQANGFSRFDDTGRLQVQNRWLSAQQAARLDAYRNLADQIYGVSLSHGKTVGTQVMNHEAYRVYVDLYLREARASDYRTLGDTLKTTLKLTLTPRFYDCMAGDVARVDACLREDGKAAFTRLAYRTAPVGNANLACINRDCSDWYSVKGFSNDRNLVDGLLLDAGLYDAEWTVNTGARALFNYMLVNGLLNAL